MTDRPIRVCLYSPADLNLVNGSAIWVQAVASTLQSSPNVEVVLPLRSLERRRLITNQLRALPRVMLVDPRRQRRWVPPSGLLVGEALDLIERLHREDPFDAIILRTFGHCLAAIERPSLRGVLWSTYVLEPERDVTDPAHVAELSRIAQASRYIVVQSEEMRALFEAAVPAGRGKTILLPPAVPELGSPAGSGPPTLDLPPPGHRLFYAGKFHPFYPVPRMIDLLETLRIDIPDLEFEVIGDQIYGRSSGSEWATSLERRLRTTPGVVWRGAVSREAVIGLLSQGGVALSLWDYAHGPSMNDLVVSTKLLDYCLAGVPVILNRTAAQEAILGSDYPLFVRETDEALPLLRAVFADAGRYRAAAERCRAAARAFSYPAVFQGVAPYLEARPDANLHLVARPKLPGATDRLGFLLAAGTDGVPGSLLEIARAGLSDGRWSHVVIGVEPAPGDPGIEPGADPSARLRSAIPDDIAGRATTRTVDDRPNWWRTIGAVAVLPDTDEHILAEATTSGTVLVNGPAASAGW